MESDKIYTIREVSKMFDPQSHVSLNKQFQK